MRRTAFVLPPVLALILWGYALAEAPTAAPAPIFAARTIYAAPAPDDYLAAPTPQPSPPKNPDISDLVPERYRSLVIETAARYDLNPRLLAAVGWVESRWRKGASGSAGEVGLLQILPSTADWIAARMGLERYDLVDPATNLNMAAWYLRHTIDAEGSVERGLAAYNGGPRAWDRKPLSTRAYVDRVRMAQQR